MAAPYAAAVRVDEAEAEEGGDSRVNSRAAPRA